MAGRARIATAACLMASGLLVTGGSASLAFANPDDDGAGTGAGTAIGNTAEGPTEQSAGPLGVGPTTTAGGSIAGTTGSTGATAPSTNPTSTVGNGRTGLESTPSEVTAGATGTQPPSEELEGDLEVTEPTVEPEIGKPAEDIPLGGDVGGDLVEHATDGTSASGSIGTSETPAQEPTGLDVIFPTTLDPEATVGGQLEGAFQSLALEAPEEQQPGVSWPWSWWDWSFQPTPDGDGGGGGGALPTSPIFSVPEPPPMLIPLLQIPRQLLYDITGIAQPFINAVTGLATAASQLPFAAVTLPVIVPSGAGVGAPHGGGGGAGGVTAPSVPRIDPPAAPTPEFTPAPPKELTPPPPARQQPSPPATPASNDLLPAPTYRMGYVDYLRAAGLGEVAAVAVPGVTGILVLTSAGGLIGYRQARAGRAVRAGGPARFMG